MDTGNKGLSFREVADETLAEFDEAALNTSPASDEDEATTPSTVTEQPVRKTSKPSILGDLMPDEDDGENTTVSDSSRVFHNGEWLTVGELKSGYLRQADYTRKTQEVAQEREEYANAITLWKALQDSPSETLRKLNQQINMGQKLEPVKAKTEITDIDALVEQKLQERLENNPVLRSLMDDRARSAVNSELQRIETKFGLTLADEDKRIIIDKARELGTTDLEFVFSGLYAQAERVRAEKKNLKDSSTTFGYRGDSDTVVEDDDDEVPFDFRDALAQASKALKIESLI